MIDKGGGLMKFKSNREFDVSVIEMRLDWPLPSHSVEQRSEMVKRIINTLYSRILGEKVDDRFWFSFEDIGRNIIRESICRGFIEGKDFTCRFETPKGDVIFIEYGGADDYPTFVRREPTRDQLMNPQIFFHWVK